MVHIERLKLQIHLLSFLQFSGQLCAQVGFLPDVSVNHTPGAYIFGGLTLGEQNSLQQIKAERYILLQSFKWLAKS